MNNESYNGWTNYNTWKVNLECFDDLDGYHDAETLEELATDFYLEDVNNALAEGIVIAFLSDVNWNEIAEAHTTEEA